MKTSTANTPIHVTIPRKLYSDTACSLAKPSTMLNDYGIRILVNFIMDSTKGGESIETTGQTNTAA